MIPSTLEKLIEKGVKLTPMMEQYYSIKKNYSEMIVLFRMGDFYEVFFEDAQQTAKLLNITLTHRGKIDEILIPMAGIPWHAASNYIDRLTNLNQKVAICEQVENPKDSQGIVKRAVTQIVGPALPYDLDQAKQNDSYYLVSACQNGEDFFIIRIDFTTGEFKAQKVRGESAFFDRVLKVLPKEFLSYPGQWDHLNRFEDFLNQHNILHTTISQDYFSPQFTEIYIKTFIPNFQRDETLNSEKNVLSPIGAITYYISSTQMIEDCVHIQALQFENESEELKISMGALYGLEILPRNREQYKESLLGLIDKTQSSLGQRQLKNLLMAPLRDSERIFERQEIIHIFLQDDDLLFEIRKNLSQIRDLERILAKISTKKVTPSDLLNIAQSVDIYNHLNQIIPSSLKEKKSFFFLSPEIIKKLIKFSENIIKTINDELGASLDKGNLILPNVNKERDRLSKLSQNVSDQLLELENKYREETQIQKLRIKYNNVSGHFIEVTKSHVNKVPSHFQRKQTLTNSERFMTEELLIFEKEIVSAKDKLQRIEREIFNQQISHLKELTSEIQNLAKSFALIDCFQSLAFVAREENFVRPHIEKKKQIVSLKKAWHPLIKSLIKDEFVPHDLELNKENYFSLITGPNMAGKTTVMREVAIIQILAQIGSYVPAQKAILGICDFIFSRLGASDDILKGQSTFMVEMAETAEIVRHATNKSLIILDEVGRGTSTHDGLSIAWALCEHLIKKTRALTLFATHYHELIDVIEELPHANNLTVEISHQNGEVHFLYGLVKGGATQSYGVHVAQLAGIPSSILKRSQNLLDRFEKKSSDFRNQKKEELKEYPSTQLSFFPNEMTSCPFSLEEHHRFEEVQKELKAIEISHVTPIEALNKLNQIKNLIH